VPDFFDLPALNYEEVKPDTREGDIVKWCDLMLVRGKEFIETAVGFDKIAIAERAIFAFENQSTASYSPSGGRKLSQTRVNLIAKIAEDLTAMLTDTRYFWNYTTLNPKYQKQAENSNKEAERWYIDNQIDLRIGDVIRYWTFAGTGVLHHYFSRRLNDFMVEAEDPRNVYPVDPISYHTFQDCKGVIVRRARTPDWVKEEFNKDVKPDVGGRGLGFFGWLTRLIEGPGERGGPLAKKTGTDQGIPATPTVFVNTLYLKDPRVNKTSQTVRMGPWEEVEVPGESDPITGIPGPKKKQWQGQTQWSYEVKPDAPLYPFNRMIVWGGNTLLHDGPCPYWHAKFPLIKFTLNPWPKAWFGKAPLWDCIPLEESVNKKLRVVDDHCEQVAQPGIVADRNVSKAEVQKADTRAAGMKIRTNMASGKGLNIIHPPPLDAMIMQSIEWSIQMMMRTAGTVDPSSLASLGQMPSDDTIDTLFKTMTPGVRLRSRALEGCYKSLAEFQLYGMMEFGTLAKRVAMLGPSAATREDFDFDYGTQIPDDVPDGEPGDIAGDENALGLENPRPAYERCKVMLQSFTCQFDPSSLLNSANQEELMKYFMMSKMGFCSVFTLWEKMGKLAAFVPAGITVPPDELGRLALQQQLGIGMIANAQGRKATDQAPPAMGQNSNGPTITSSG
jgi:hypothetical protein